MSCNDSSSRRHARFAGGQAQRQMLCDVAAALRSGRTALAFQPVVQASRRDTPAFHEGLIRIFDARGEAIPAGRFIAAAEPRSMGRSIDCAALRHGLTALSAKPDLRLALNMSVRSIGHRGWMRILDEGLERDPTAGERLIIEITERSAIVAPDLLTSFMDRLRLRGIAFALDDFGAGYTSFRHFRQFRFDILKIDGEFCRGIEAQPDNRFLVSTLQSIARHFECFTVAEMVERPAEAELLTELGLDSLQGWLFGKPMLRPDWLLAPAGERRAG